MGYDYPNSDMPGKSEGEQLFSEEPQPDNRPVDIDGSRRYFCGEVDTLRDDHYDTHEPGASRLRSTSHPERCKAWWISVSTARKALVTDHPNETTPDRLNKATYKWPKSVSEAVSE